MARLELRLLGGLDVRVDGARAVLPTRHCGLLLAYLAVTPGMSESRERLATLLRGERADEQARASLRQTLYRLKEPLEGVEPAPLVSDPRSVSLTDGLVRCDVAAFERAISGDEEALLEALDLYKGDLLADCGRTDPAFEDWLVEERERLRRLAADGFHRLAEMQQAGRRFREMEATARKLVELDPYDEAARRLQMTACARRGQRNAALAIYKDLADLLDRELDVEPEPETDALLAAIRDGEIPAAECAGEQNLAADAASAAAAAPEAATDENSVQTTDGQPNPRTGEGSADLAHPTPPSPTGRWLAGAAAAGLLIAIMGAVYWFVGQPPREEPASLERMAFPLPDKPSIAVLPFANLSEEPGRDYVADALTNDIITDLSRFRDFLVIASNSTFTYKGRPVKIQQVAEELGVHYVLEGSVQTAGTKIRVNAQLIDALTGKHLWAERYSPVNEDVFALQDEITQKIVSTLGGQDGRIAKSDLERAKAKGTRDLTAYEFLLLGIELRHQFTPEKNTRAGEFCQKAADLDPQFSRAYVCLGFVHYLDYLYGWTSDPDRSLAEGFAMARKAVELDPMEAEAHWILADMYWVLKQHKQAIESYRRAMEINPNNADILSEWGWNMVFLTGEAEEAVANIKRAMRLNPFHDDWYEQGLGIAAYAARRYEEAVAALAKVRYHAIDSRAAFAASYAQLGRMKEAKQQVDQIMKLQPNFTISQWIDKNAWAARPCRRRDSLSRGSGESRPAG